jgi:glycosyltransferase involved in cell wall biosynthesis
MIKITAFCPTLNRPELLGRMIKCFENQTYPNRELIILDDGGQYENQKGDKWQLISVPRRFRTLGEKNNAVMAMAATDSEAYAKADDDDIYMPWWLESIADGLKASEVCQPRYAIDYVKGEWVQIETHNANFTRTAYHGCWGYRRSLIERIGGYRAEYAGDDQELDRRLRKQGIAAGGIASKYLPFYWYNRPLPGRISERGGSQAAYLATGALVTYVGKVPEWTGEKVWERAIPAKRVQRGW